MRLISNSIKILACSMALLVTIPAQAADVVKELGNGGINWSAGTIYAHGYGVPKAGTKGGKARLLARRAAQVDAYRNLAEIVQGVRVNSQTVVQDMMLSSDLVKTSVDAVIKGAVITKDHYQNEVASVTMQIPIEGNLMSALVPEKAKLMEMQIPPTAFEIIRHQGKVLFKQSLTELGKFSPIASAYAADTINITNADDAKFSRELLQWLAKNDPALLQQMLQSSIQQFESAATYTGLLIDASSVVDFELAAVPTIRNPAGDIVYPTEQTSYDDMVKKRPVSYDFDVEDAIRNVRVATTPFVISALNTYKSRKSDLVISNEDALTLAENSVVNNVMNQAGVMVVVAD